MEAEPEPAGLRARGGGRMGGRYEGVSRGKEMGWCLNYSKGGVGNVRVYR